MQAAELQYRIATDPNRDAILQEIDQYVKASNISDPVRVLQLYMAVKTANELELGDYIEVGTLLGFSLRVIHRFMDPGCVLFALDTFEGFAERDLKEESAVIGPHPWVVGNFHPTSVGIVRDYLGDPQNLCCVPGWFPDTFKGLEDRRWRFAHIDVDLYAPTKAALELLWPGMVAGGIIMVHDYRSPDFGCRKAVDGFCHQLGVYPVEVADYNGSVLLRKGGW